MGNKSTTTSVSTSPSIPKTKISSNKYSLVQNEQAKLNAMLYEAVHYGHSELVQDLIDKGAQPCEQECNSEPSKKMDVFTAATMRAGRVSEFDLEQLSSRVLKVIQQAFSEIEKSNNHNHHAILPRDLQLIIESYCNFDRLDCLRLLYQSGLKPLPNINSAIFDALSIGDIEAIEIMLYYEGNSIVKKKKIVEYSGDTISTLKYCLRQRTYSHLHYPASYSYGKCVQLLIEAKADINETGLLEDAYCNYQHDIVVQLIQAGANKFTEEDFNPLWQILNSTDLTEEQNIQAVQYLIETNLCQQKYHNFEGLGQNEMCLPRYVPPTAYEYALKDNKNKLSELIASLK